MDEEMVGLSFVRLAGYGLAGQPMAPPKRANKDKKPTIEFIQINQTKHNE